MKRLMTIILAVTLVAVGQTAWAVSDQVQTVQDATAVLNDFVNIPENAIPPALLSQAYGIAIVPGVIKAGFVVGGRYGEGILSVRTADGSWSHPVFINLAGASLGWQIGAASSDIILVFKTQRGVDQIVNGQITLGGDVSIAAGPVGRTASAATNLTLDSEIYSYSRSRGLFAGLALEGGVISIDKEDNWRYYGDMIKADKILHSNNIKTLPKTAERLIYTLNRYMPAINASGGPIPYGDVGAADGRVDNSQRQRSGDNQAQAYGAGQAQPNARGQAQPYGSNQTMIQIRSRQTSRSGAARNRPVAPASGVGANNNYGPVYEKPSDNMNLDATKPQGASGSGG